MFDWFRSLFAGLQPPQPAGPPVVIKRLSAGDTPIAESAGWKGDELRVAVAEAATVRLFEVPVPGREQCLLTYRLEISTDALKSSVYPEMWCRVPGRGEFFSRGLQQKVTGTNNSLTLEIPFILRRDQKADLLKLNLIFQGAGVVRLKNVEILETPLAG